MFDLLASIGSAAISDIIKRAIAAGIDWGKRRKKPPSEEVAAKGGGIGCRRGEEDATTGIDRRATAHNQRITELTLPTFEQVVDYSPNTRGIVHAARSAVKKAGGQQGCAKESLEKNRPQTCEEGVKEGVRAGADLDPITECSSLAPFWHLSRRHSAPGGPIRTFEDGERLSPDDLSDD